MTALTDHAAMTRQIAHGAGFIAALDQSGGSTPKALSGYGIASDAYDSDEAMFALIHAMRARIINAPCFNGDKVIGAILFERTMDGDVAGVPVPAALIARGVVPFIKIDKGLEDEADGVQLMKPMPDLDALLARAKALGVFGTKARSVINALDGDGIARIVGQQFMVAEQVLAAGMVPILEPEVSIGASDRADVERLLCAELEYALDDDVRGPPVMLKLTIPAEPGIYQPLVDHPRVLRLVALSGGFTRSEACTELARNPGMIASFSRALLADLRHQMSDAEFASSLGSAIDEIHAASIA